MTKVRVRFAPSPTGFLHIGGLRTALFNYLFAKNNQGAFILRLEDTDRERYLPAGAEQILSSLKWTGLIPDEGYWDNKHIGQHAPYSQSERHLVLGIYEHYAKQLLSDGLAYYSYIAGRDYEKYRNAAIKSSRPFVYRKRLEREYHTGARAINKSEPYPIRLDVEKIRHKAVLAKHRFLSERLDWVDAARGDFSEALSNIEDFVIIKSDGYPTYNFANVIDDHDMRISHVLRGDEFLSSTAKHILLYYALGFKQIPVFAHLPPINGVDGKKLSKRTGDTNVLDYRDKGYLPEAVINFLALLGWNDSSEQEIFTTTELIKKFSIARVQKSPAVFDAERLKWMNGVYIRQLKVDELAKRAEEFWPAAAKKADIKLKQKVLDILQDRLKLLSELPELSIYFFTTPKLTKTTLKTLKTQFSKANPSIKLADWLTTVRKWLDQADISRRDRLEADLRELINQHSPKAAPFFIALRIVLTASDQTPPIWDIIYALGKAETTRRLEATIAML